jgi:hypothetical protein
LRVPKTPKKGVPETPKTRVPGEDRGNPQNPKTTKRGDPGGHKTRKRGIPGDKGGQGGDGGGPREITENPQILSQNKGFWVTAI